MIRITGSLNEHNRCANDMDDDDDDDSLDDDDDDDQSPLPVRVDESEAEPDDRCGGSSISTTLRWLIGPSGAVLTTSMGPFLSRVLA